MDYYGVLLSIYAISIFPDVSMLVFFGYDID